MTVIIPGSVLTGPSGDDTLIIQGDHWLGSYGDVYKAIDTVSNEIFAVKVPRTSALFSSKDLQAFLREAHIAQEIVHPNVVRVMHVEDAHPTLPPYMVMEFISGGTLSNRLDELTKTGTLLPWNDVIAIVTELIDGIAAVNERIVHRDLKPSNIMIDSGHPKICDLGMAKIIGEMTRSQTVKGFQADLYRAPESWASETDTIQLDMYCMGMILYQLTTLRYPYVVPDRPSFAAYRDMHMYAPVIPIETIRPDVPIRFSHLIRRLLEKSAKMRYAAWKEAKEALKEPDGPGMPVRSHVANLLEAAKVQYDAISVAEAKHLSEQETKALKKRNAFFMEHRLRSDVDAVVREYNAAHPVGGVLRVDWASESAEEPAIGAYTVQVRIPLALPLSFRAYSLDPPLFLSVGQVDYAVTLSSNTEMGTHFLLVHSDPTDLYGEWIVCHVEVSGIVQGQAREKYNGRLPFSNRDDWNRLVASDQNIINGYDVTYDTDIQKAFVDMVRRVMSAGR